MAKRQATLQDREMPQWKWWNLRWVCPQEGNSLPSPPGQVGQVSIFSLSAPSPSFPALLVTLVPASLASGQDAQLYQQRALEGLWGRKAFVFGVPVCSSLALVCSTEHSAEMGTPRGQIQRHQSCRYLPRVPQSNTHCRQARLVPGTRPSHADFQQGPQLGPSPGVARPNLPKGKPPCKFLQHGISVDSSDFPRRSGLQLRVGFFHLVPFLGALPQPYQEWLSYLLFYSLWIYIPLHLLVTP